VVVGDGGFQMTMCELATAAQEKIKVNVAIINNQFLGMVRQWQEFFYDKRYAATPITGPDFVKLAEAFGLKGLRATKRAEMTATVAATLKNEGTVVIDFVVEKEDTVFPMVPAGADLDKMIRRPKQDVLLESGTDKDWEMPAAPVVAPVAAKAATNGHARKAAKAAKPVKVAKSARPAVAKPRTALGRR
jgi:acetolactate synthase-1/2/3 large subunit